MMSVELSKILTEITEIKNLWSYGYYDEYRRCAEQFLKERRPTLMQIAATTAPNLKLVRCFTSLLVFQDRVSEADESVRRASEDQAIELMETFKPNDAAGLQRHLFQKHASHSNIHKRRAFAEAADGNLSLASSLMREAVRSARQSIEFASASRLGGAMRHLEYLRFHDAVLKLRVNEAKGKDGLTSAMQAWNAARQIVETATGSAKFFPGYIWDVDDLKNYGHLLSAQAAWHKRDFGIAVREYDTWIESLKAQHGRRWRFRNIEVRKHLAVVLNCLMRSCDGCDRCRDSTRHLQLQTQDGFLGDAGRQLASTGLALMKLGGFGLSPELLDKVTTEIDSYISIASQYSQPMADIPAGHYLKKLPSYFTSVSSEVKRLEQMGFSVDAVRDFVLPRFREFLEINCEYEEGRLTAFPPEQTDPAAAILSEIVGRIVKARRRRKGAKDRGVSEWESVKRTVSRIEVCELPNNVTQAFDTVLSKVSGLFPTIVRIVEVQENGPNFKSLAETLDGERFEVSSQFRLAGKFGYLPPRYSHNPADLTLKAKDRSLWTMSKRVEGVYRLQNVPLWEGIWSELAHEHFECLTLDYKQQLPHRIAKHLAAFANTKGGFLVFGVYDPDRSPGISVRSLTLSEAAETTEKICLAGLNEVSPPMIPASFFRAYPNGKLVILCRIDASTVGPRRVDDRIYVRVGARSEPLSDEKWKALKAI